MVVINSDREVITVFILLRYIQGKSDDSLAEVTFCWKCSMAHLSSYSLVDDAITIKSVHSRIQNKGA